MHDPAGPAGPSSDPVPTSGVEYGSTYDSALDKVRQVIAWYSEQIMKEHRSPGPDDARLERLIARRLACVADQQALEDAGPQEVARIAVFYDALYKELTEP